MRRSLPPRTGCYAKCSKPDLPPIASRSGPRYVEPYQATRRPHDSRQCAQESELLLKDSY